MRMTHVSAGLIATQMLTSVAPSCAAASARNGALKPSASVPVAAAAAPTTNLRRERRWPFPKIIFFMALSSRPAGGAIGRAAGAVAGGLMHRFADALVSAAAADVGHRLVDIGVGRLRLFLQERGGGHDLAGLAIAALRHVDCGPGLLHRMRGIGREALDRDDLVARLHGGERDRARSLHLAIDVHRAGAALRNTAAVF